MFLFDIYMSSLVQSMSVEIFRPFLLDPKLFLTEAFLLIKNEFIKIMSLFHIYMFVFPPLALVSPPLLLCPVITFRTYTKASEGQSSILMH